MKVVLFSPWAVVGKLDEPLTSQRLGMIAISKTMTDFWTARILLLVLQLAQVCRLPYWSFRSLSYLAGS